MSLTLTSWHMRCSAFISILSYEIQCCPEAYAMEGTPPSAWAPKRRQTLGSIAARCCLRRGGIVVAGVPLSCVRTLET